VFSQVATSDASLRNTVSNWSANAAVTW
jgi:hypothetical protein